MTVDPGKNEQQILLHAVRKGDTDAFAELVGVYQQQVFMCCRLLGLKADEAEDVASETFLAAYKGIGKYSGRAKLGTWLWKIAYNKAVDYIRKKTRFQNMHQQLQNHYSDEQKTAAPEIQTELVWDAVKKLPSDHAMAVVLFYRQDKSIKEIANIMNKRQNTVKVYLYRGRERLKELLGDKVERFG